MTEIDIGLIENQESQEQLHIAEENLIEEYLEGDLTEAEIDLFKKNFLTSEERSSQLTTIAELKRYSQNLQIDKEEKTKLRDSEPTFFRGLSRIFSSQPISVAATLLVVGFFGTIAWFSFFANNGLEAEYASRNTGDFSDISKFTHHKNIALLREKERGMDYVDPILQSEFTESLFVRVAIKSDKKEREAFNLKVVKGEKVLFSQKSIGDYKNESGRELRFLLPSEILEPGIYFLKIESVENPNNTLTRSFTIK